MSMAERRRLHFWAGDDARLGGDAILELGSRAAGGIDGDLPVVAGLEDAVDGDNAWVQFGGHGGEEAEWVLM